LPPLEKDEIIESGHHRLRCIYGHGGRPGYEKEWRASKEICGGGELLDQGVHVVDLFRWFLGEFEEAVGYTQTWFWPMEVEDNAFAVFRTSTGRTAMMHTSWTQWKNRFTFEIFGQAGYLIVEGLGGSYGVEKLIVGSRPRNADTSVGSGEENPPHPPLEKGGEKKNPYLVQHKGRTSRYKLFADYTSRPRTVNYALRF
jgi:predicted dehydrogenase